MKYVIVIFLLAVSGLVAGCSSDSNPLAEYEGERPLTFQRVTQNYRPDIQWVGGRVAAVGINRGSRAALDSTLVWLKTAGDNSINSHVTVGPGAPADVIAGFGGTAVDSLMDATEYTFWVAEKSAWDARLAAGSLDGFNFTDTTLTTKLKLSGNSRGGAGVTITISRFETLTSEKYVVEWTPADIPFRRVAIRQGAAVPGFQDLVWHNVLADETADSIYSPLVIGQTPTGTTEVIAFPEDGFEPSLYTYWMVNSNWDGTFGLRAPGLAFFTIFANNFE